jgi:hypothetical protein
MIRVSMRKQNPIDVRKLGHLDARRCYAGQKEAELIIKVWISQYASVTKIQ